MVSSVADFKRRARKVVRLPSGLEVEIRKVKALDFIDLGELPLPVADGNKREAGNSKREKALSPEEIHRYCSRAIVVGARNPAFSDRPEDESSDAVVHVKDLDAEDFTALAFEIMAFSNMGSEVAAAADSFRTDQIGPTGGGPGGEISQAPDGDLEPDPGGDLSQPGGDLARVDKEASGA